jgi:hypothetical protein
VANYWFANLKMTGSLVRQLYCRTQGMAVQLPSQQPVKVNMADHYTSSVPRASFLECGDSSLFFLETSELPHVKKRR